MIEPACSGLWRDGTAYKSPLLDHARFWVSPDMPRTLRELIVSDVMPTLGEWTRLSWEEVGERPSEAFTALLWQYAEPYQDGANNPDCAEGVKKWLGCAHHRSGEIEIRNVTYYGGRPPLVYLRETALHEALHIFYRATHAETGIMCVDRDASGCGLRKVSSGGYRWTLRLSNRDTAVYSLFAHPAIENGMTLAEVASLFGVTVTTPPTPTPLPAPDRQVAEDLAIAAGTRCSGLASLRAVVWEVYPRLDADGVLTLSGSIEQGGPSIKDARKSYSGNIHPAFTLYAIELGTNERGNVSSVGRVWPQEMASRVSGRGSPNAFADVYNVTRDRFEVVVTLPVSLLGYEQLHVTVWSSLVEDLSRPTGSTAGLGSCKVWRVD